MLMEELQSGTSFSELAIFPVILYILFLLSFVLSIKVLRNKVKESNAISFFQIVLIVIFVLIKVYISQRTISD